MIIFSVNDFISPVPGFSASEKKLIYRCWFTYTAFYLGRVNISPAFPLLAAALGVSFGEVGWLGTVFFWSYGIGQFVHGQLGNVIRPRWMVFFGLLTIATTNLLFSTQQTLVPLLVLWAINGFAQAAGWGPLLRILNTHFDPNQNRKLATPFAMSFQIGTSISWIISLGLIAAGSGWQTLFWVPGIILSLAALAWWFSGLDAPLETSDTKVKEFRLREIVIEVSTWWPLLYSAAFTGFAYLGLLLWLPTLIAENVPLSENWLRVQTALLPLIGVPGMMIAGWLLTSGRNPIQASSYLQVAFIASTLSSALLGNWVILFSLFIAIMAASGLASLTLSAFPLLLAKSGRVSSAGGLLTAVWSIAGGASGTLIGSLAENGRWSIVLAIWAACIIFALFFIQLVNRKWGFAT